MTEGFSPGDRYTDVSDKYGKYAEHYISGFEYATRTYIVLGRLTSEIILEVEKVGTPAFKDGFFDFDTEMVTEIKNIFVQEIGAERVKGKRFQSKVKGFNLEPLLGIEDYWVLDKGLLSNYR